MAQNPQKPGPPGAAGNNPANTGTAGSGEKESGVTGVQMKPIHGPQVTIPVDNQITPGATTEAGKATAEQAGAGKQPTRPDETTQQPRPNVGGRTMAEAHPELAGSMETAQDRFPNPATQTLEQARERSKSGNVYVIAQEILGCSVPVGGIAADVDLPKNSDFARLLRIGAIQPAEPLRSDPTARIRSADELDEIEGLQRKCERYENENDRLAAENARLSSELERLRKA